MFEHFWKNKISKLFFLVEGSAPHQEAARVCEFFLGLMDSSRNRFKFTWNIWNRFNREKIKFFPIFMFQVMVIFRLFCYQNCQFSLNFHDNSKSKNRKNRIFWWGASSPTKKHPVAEYFLRIGGPYSEQVSVNGIFRKATLSLLTTVEYKIDHNWKSESRTQKKLKNTKNPICPGPNCPSTELS